MNCNISQQVSAADRLKPTLAADFWVINFQPVIIHFQSGSKSRVIGESCGNGYLDTVRQLKCPPGHMMIDKRKRGSMHPGPWII